jgi:tetratricopeptide (TPR) repeat protein
MRAKRQLFAFLLLRLIHYSLLFAVAYLIVLFFTAFSPSAPAEPADPLPAIQKALDRADFARARELLTKALKDKPHDPKLLFLAGQTARRAEAFEEAEKYFKECDRLKVASDGVALERALIRAQSGDLKDVETELVKAGEKEENPDGALILEALGRGNARIYRFSRALEFLSELLRRYPDNIPALLERAKVWGRASVDNWGREPGHHPNAVADYRKVVELDPDNFEARLLLAEALSDDPNEAITEFEHLQKAQPKNAAVLLGMARCRIALSETDEARKLVDAILEKDAKNAAALRERAQVDMVDGEPAKAESWLQKALEIEPLDRKTVYTMLLCERQLGKEKESKPFFETLKSIETDRERLNDIMRKLNESTEDTALYHEAGALMLRLGQKEEGVRCLQHVLLLDPKHRPTHAALADYYEKIGKKSLAAEHRKKAKPDGEK